MAVLVVVELDEGVAEVAVDVVDELLVDLEVVVVELGSVDDVVLEVDCTLVVDLDEGTAEVVVELDEGTAEVVVEDVVVVSTGFKGPYGGW